MFRWKKEEHGLRTGIWFCCNGFGQILGAVVSYGIAVGIKQNGYTALAGWQIMFLFTGSLTVLCGILFYFVVPDSPATAWFLSREEKVMALERIRGNEQGVGNKHFKKYQIVAALKDPFVSHSIRRLLMISFSNNYQTWLLFTFSICSNIVREYILIFRFSSSNLQLSPMVLSRISRTSFFRALVSQRNSLFFTVHHLAQSKSSPQTWYVTPQIVLSSESTAQSSRWRFQFWALFWWLHCLRITWEEIWQLFISRLLRARPLRLYLVWFRPT